MTHQAREVPVVSLLGMSSSEILHGGSAVSGVPRLLIDLPKDLNGCGDLASLLEALAGSLHSAIPFISLALLLPQPLAEMDPSIPGAGPGPGGCTWLLDVEAPELALSGDKVLQCCDRLGAAYPNRQEAPAFTCCAVLLSQLRNLGSLRICRTVSTGFTASETTILSSIALQVGGIVEKILGKLELQTSRRTLVREQKHLETLLRITNAVVSKLEMKDLLEEVAVSVRSVVGNQYCSLVLLDAATDTLRWEAVHFPGREDVISPGTIKPMDDSPASTSFRTRKPFVVDYPHLCKLARTFQPSRALLQAGLRCLCSVPLIARDRPLGVLSVGHTDRNNISPEDVDLLVEIAGQVAIAADNAMAYHQITQMKERLASEKEYLQEEIRDDSNFEEIVGHSRGLAKVLAQVEMVAESDCPVLILGETGTGKELIARAIHNLSTRRSRSLVKLNCAAIPTGLLESDLFGHEKGAFTGAISKKIGRLELAHQGTLFMDEIGDIPLELQPKLLRALQEQEFERLGSSRLLRVDVRIISATNRDLQDMISKKEFRSDLFYRLNVFPIEIPPLRERSEDIPPLLKTFTERYARRLKRNITHIPPEAVAAMMRYDWPGNVRELEHVVQRAVVISRGTTLELDPSGFRSSAAPHGEAMSAHLVNSNAAPGKVPPVSEDLTGTLNQMERDCILRALRETNGVIAGPKGAAVRLGLKRTTLVARMQRLNISREDL